MLYDMINDMICLSDLVMAFLVTLLEPHTTQRFPPHPVGSPTFGQKYCRKKGFLNIKEYSG